MAGNNNRITYTLDFKANLTDIQGQLNKLKQSLNSLATPRMGKVSKEFEVASASAAKLEHHIRNAFNADTGKLDLSRLNMSLKNTGDNLSGLMNNLIQGGKSGREAFMQVTNAISNAQQPLIKTNALFSKMWTTMKNTMRWQISSMALTSIYSGISKAFNYAKDLNSTLNDIRIVTGDSAAEMERFAKSANKMAKAVGSTTLDVAKGTLIYRQQGDEAELAAKKAEITTKAANVAFNVSADEMSQYLTAIWNSYKVGEDQLELFVDKLAVVGAETATDMAEISTAMEKVAATANTTGVTYDQLLATISTVSSVTRQSAETVGTAFKTIYARIGDLKIDGETVDEDGVAVKLGQVSEQLGAANIHILDANGSIRDMGAIVEEIGGKWQTLESAEKQAIAQTIAGKRQYTQVMALFENWDMYEKTLGKVADAQGALNNQNEIFKESWEGALKEVSNNWQRLITTLISDDFIIDVIEGFAKFVDILATVTDSLGGFKSILLMIATIFTAKLQPQMARGLLSLAQNFMIVIGQGDRLNQTLLKTANDTINAKIASGELTKQEGILAKTMMQVANATEMYNQNVLKMDIVAKNQGKLAIDTMKKNLESLQNELREATVLYDSLRSGQSANLKGIKGIGSRQALGKEVNTMLEKGNMTGSQWNSFYRNAAVKYGLDPKQVRDYSREMRVAYNNVKNTEKGIINLGDEAENTGRKMITTGKTWGQLDFTQKISLATTSLMNVQMVMTSLNSIWDTFNDNSKTTGEKIGAAFTALIPIIMSVTSALSAATAAGDGLMTVLWPMLVVAGITIAWKTFDKLHISAKEATKNIKELNAEFKDLKSEISENKSKSNTVEDLYKEYETLQELIKYGKTSQEQKDKLVEISNTLVDTYGLEVSGLKDLTGAYQISKQAVDEYTNALRRERLEKQEDLKENRNETIENINTLKNSEKKKSLTNNFFATKYYTSDKKIKLKEENLKKAGFTEDEIKSLFEEYNGKIATNSLQRELKNKIKNKINKINKDIVDYNKQIDQKYNSQIASATLDIMEQDTLDILNQDEFNFMSGIVGSYISNGTNQYAEDIRNDEKIREKYLEKVKNFSTTYQGVISDIVEQNQELVTQAAQGELNTLSKYGDYYSNLQNQAKLITKSVDEGIISKENGLEQLNNLTKQIESDIGLSLAKINEDFTGKFNKDQKTVFSKFSDDILQLKSDLQQGEIDYDNYITSVTSKISDVDWSMMKFDKQDGQITDEFTASMLHTFAQLGEEANNAFLSGIKKGKGFGEDDIQELDAMTSYYENLASSMQGAFDNEDMVNNAISNLKEYKEELETLNTIFKKLEKNTYKSTKEMATDLNKLGVTYGDLKQAGVKNADKLLETNKDLNKDSKLSVEQLQSTLGDGQTAQDNAQKIAIQRQKESMIKTAVASQTIVDNLVKNIKNTFMGFKFVWDDDKKEFRVEGTGKTGSEVVSESARTAFAEAYDIEDDYGLKMAAANYTSAQVYNELQRHYKGNENDPGYIRAKASYYKAKALGASSSTVGVAGQVAFQFDNDSYNTEAGTGVAQPTDDKGDKFDPESTVEAQINDLIDKYRTIPALLLEALENEADMLDENIHGWEKIVENQIQQNIIRDDLLENEKKLKEGFNTLLNGLLEKYGLTMEEVSKWFNSEGEETAYSKERINKIGISQGKDAASKEEDIVEEFGKVLKASLESDKKLDELIKEQFEGKQNYIDKFTSLMDDNNAKLEEAIEDLENADIVNYESMRDLLQLQIQNRMDLINELLAQGLAKDSPIIRELIQEIKEIQRKIIDAFDNEFEQTKNQLEEIYKEIEYQRKKKIEDLQDEITIRQKILDLEKKHNSALKDLRATQREINKELASAKMSTQWLDKETRELLFNQSDYYEVSSKVSEIQEYLNDLYVDYSEDIAALGEDELYLADSITKSYEAQVAAKKEELAILKSSLDIEKKRNALNSALSEKNVRVFAGGRWRQVANNEEVIKSYQDYVDSVQNLKEKEIENSENNLIRAEEAQIQALNNLKKSYEEQNKMMKEKLEEMEHDWNLLNSNLELSGKSLGELTKTFNDGVSQLKASMNNLHAQKQAASNVQYGFSSSGGSSGGGQNSDYVNWAKNQMAENSKNWFGADKATQDALAAANKNLASQIGATQDSNGHWIDKNGNKITGNARGRKDGPGGISQVNELGIELLATNSGQFIELNPHEKIFNNEQMNFLYDFSRRGIESTEKAVSSVSAYNDESMSIENLTLELPNVTDTNSFVEGLKGLKEHMRNVKTIR